MQSKGSAAFHAPTVVVNDGRNAGWLAPSSKSPKVSCVPTRSPFSNIHSGSFVVLYAFTEYLTASFQRHEPSRAESRP